MSLEMSQLQSWEGVDFLDEHHISRMVNAIPNYQGSNCSDKQIKVHLRKGIARSAEVAGIHPKVIIDGSRCSDQCLHHVSRFGSLIEFPECIQDSCGVNNLEGICHCSGLCFLTYGLFCKVAINSSSDPPSSSVSFIHSCNSLADIFSLAQA